MKHRWPDLVLAKIQKNPATANIAVVNQAAGGNRILADGLGRTRWDASPATCSRSRRSGSR
ncbi:hypothetical protein PHLGIDRAFT_119743 [Phlebiopsis gigantea 11061_1 CR5-6]|uniref:Uncharacterized protein n=1 Tax=Phlebiopsis gigantea (strain 11061_1 CR5-6) TaxID=745531 RepID=A0A0C3PHW4_PHLG1|nr:hypothetical protein PHLGIDRAFT_119743 [Phlebiopsis gigantea 11061_1 CR5-6]